MKLEIMVEVIFSERFRLDEKRLRDDIAMNIRMGDYSYYDYGGGGEAPFFDNPDERRAYLRLQEKMSYFRWEKRNVDALSDEEICDILDCDKKELLAMAERLKAKK